MNVRFVVLNVVCWLVLTALVSYLYICMCACRYTMELRVLNPVATEVQKTNASE